MWTSPARLPRAVPHRALEPRPLPLLARVQPHRIVRRRHRISCIQLHSSGTGMRLFSRSPSTPSVVPEIGQEPGYRRRRATRKTRWCSFITSVMVGAQCNSAVDSIAPPKACQRRPLPNSAASQAGRALLSVCRALCTTPTLADVLAVTRIPTSPGVADDPLVGGGDAFGAADSPISRRACLEG